MDFNQAITPQLTLIWLLFSLLTLSSCDQQPGAESIMVNYLSRVARPVGATYEQQLHKQGLVALEKRTLHLPLPTIRLSLFDILAITHCQPLTQKLAERNSSLGRVMSASHQFLFENALLEAINHCLQHPQTLQKPQLANQLHWWYQQKSMALPATLWNGLFSTDEMLLSLSFSTPPLAPDSARSEATIAALEFFTTQATLISNSAEDIAPQRVWDQHFFKLRQRRYLGELAQATLLATYTLNTISDWLVQRQHQRPVCPQQRPTPKAKILNTVFKKFYIGEVQPYLAHLNKLQVEWQQTMQQLLQQLPNQSNHPNWLHFKAQFIGSPDQSPRQFISFQQAAKRHARAWQQLLQQCLLMPRLID